MKAKDNNIVIKLEEALKELAIYEKKGFDASSLKIFIKNFKDYLKIIGQSELPFQQEELTFENKLDVIQNFLEDKKAFPTITEVIEFANKNLDLDFRNQKESRDITISRIIARIRTKPDLKEKLKTAVLSIRNEKIHGSKPRTKKEVISAETFSSWAEIIKSI